MAVITDRHQVVNAVGFCFESGNNSLHASWVENDKGRVLLVGIPPA
jgi:hypothetical protein